MTTKTKRLLPTGECWCGCGAEVPLGRFFVVGHDRRAVQRVIMEKFGSTPDFLLKTGYAPKGAAR
jgi:hypothetical protein